MKRWHVTVDYRSEIPSGDASQQGFITVEHDINEMYELHNLIERGPSWQTIAGILIEYTGLLERLTVEEAARR